jgi:hypothetical protein
MTRKSRYDTKYPINARNENHFALQDDERLTTTCNSPMAMRAEDAPVLSSDVHQISPMSNPNPVHATCRYAFTLSGSIFTSGGGDLDFGLSRKNLFLFVVVVYNTIKRFAPQTAFWLRTCSSGTIRGRIFYEGTY